MAVNALAGGDVTLPSLTVIAVLVGIPGRRRPAACWGRLEVLANFSGSGGYTIAPGIQASSSARSGRRPYDSC